jgi:hypothetical protein
MKDESAENAENARKDELTTEYAIQSAHREGEGETRSLALDAALVAGATGFGLKAGADIYDATVGKVKDKLTAKDETPKIIIPGEDE